MQRKPKFIPHYGFLGRCIAYPVSIHVDGRTWQDKYILVPVSQWRNGERTFHFLTDNWNGTTTDIYTCTPKVAEGIQKAAFAYHCYVKQQEELSRLQEEIEDIRHYFSNLSKHFDGIEEGM